MYRLLTDEDIVQYSSKTDFTKGGVGITVRTFKNACFSNISHRDIDENIDELLKAQDAKSIKLRDKEWIEEIESYVAGNYPYGDTILIDKEDWQTLKSKMEKDYGRFK